jgi:two-component system response regulator YesN
MRKIVLVDDEKWILESLKGTVDWNGLGFEIVGEARNGVEALARIGELLPDAAFVDIRMPGMNGLELIRRLEEADAGVLCVVASGYAEFEYAKEALRHGAVDYCLKPFSGEDMKDVLDRLGKRIERQKQALAAELLALLQEWEPPSREAVCRLLERLRFRWDDGEGAFVVVVRGGDFAGWLGANVQNMVAIRFGSVKTAYLMNGADRETFLRQIGQYSGQAAGIGIGPVFFDPTRLRERIEEAEIASFRAFAPGDGVIGTVEALQPDGLDAELLGLLGEGVGRGDMRLMREAFVLAESRFRSGRYDIRHARRLYEAVMAMRYGAEEEAGEPLVCGIDELAARFGDVYGMIASLKSAVMNDFRGEREEDREESVGEETLARIVKHIRDHFREPLSIQDLARQFHLHPNYLSQLFKKELNINFTKYLADIRMEYACHLLRTTSLSVGEIAERSGYGDYFYFARAFKRHTGKTPSEYRSRAGN